MHIQILDLISWHREINLFRTLLYLTIIKQSMQMLQVPKPSNDCLNSKILNTQELYGKHRSLYFYIGTSVVASS